VIFPPKTTVLAANVENTLVWSGADFQQSLGYAQPEKPISMAFSVQNLTSQVCYVAISYQTRDVTYQINNRRSIAGIRANTTIRLASNLAPELASLGPNLVSVTLYLISAAAGNVIVSAEGFEGVDRFGVASGGGENVGLDQRAVLDYILIFLADGQNVPPITAITSTYIVPVGKRSDVVSINADIDPTPAGYKDAHIAVSNSPNTFKWVLWSQQFVAVNAFQSNLGSLQAGDVLSLSLINSNASVARQMNASIMIKEYFS